MTRPIVTLPAEILHVQATAATDPSSPEIQSLIADMKDSCVAARGIGLAAPQIGVSLAVAVINMPGEEPYALLNPEIVWASKGTSALEEGCLSVPDTAVAVPRPKKVRVRAVTEAGDLVEITADDLLAKVLQHEIDHLNGVLIVDHHARR